MFDPSKMSWTPTALPCTITPDRIEITTQPQTDLWARTFGDFCRDNAPVLQAATTETCFIFTAKVTFEGACQYDQAGLIMYLNADTWFKASMECENDEIKHLGSVVTNHGYSDWATTAVPASITAVWYRMTRKNGDFLLECSLDGTAWNLLRMFHMWQSDGEISYGVYACSPGSSSFTATFSELDFQVKDAADLAL